MAKFLRPRRGSKDNAIAQKILLKKGELFLEFPMSDIGKGPGRLVIGDGATSYQNMNYTSTATNVFRPFITDPELFVPRFDNSTYQTSEWTVDAGTEAINAMGDGSSASTVAIPTLIGNIKNALCKHANSIIRINNDVANKADKTIFSGSADGLVPKSTNPTATYRFLCADGQWRTPEGALATTESNGSIVRLSGNPESFLRGNNSWGYGSTVGSAGLLRALPTDEEIATTYNETDRKRVVLSADGRWHRADITIDNASTAQKGLMKSVHVQLLNSINRYDTMEKGDRYLTAEQTQDAGSTGSWYASTAAGTFLPEISSKGTYLVSGRIYIGLSSAPTAENKCNLEVSVGHGYSSANDRLIASFPVTNKDQEFTFSTFLKIGDNASTGSQYIMYRPRFTTGLAATVSTCGDVMNLRSIDAFSD